MTDMKRKYMPPVLETAPVLTAQSILLASNEEFIIDPIDAGLQ